MKAMQKGFVVSFGVQDAPPPEVAETLPFRRLWVEVLRKAIDNSLGAELYGAYDRGANPAAAQARAVRWFGTRDFREVCLLAGLEPEYILRKWRQARADVAAGRMVRQGASWVRVP